MSLLIHLWYLCLVLADRLMGTHLVEWELARVQRRVETYEAMASAIQQQMEELHHSLHAAQVALCVTYLRQRRIFQPETWLRFAPAESRDDEKDLDLLIDRLVKNGLSTVRTEATGTQTYVYHLCPDWAAIAALLSARQEQLDPATIAWLEELRSDEHREICH